MSVYLRMLANIDLWTCPGAVNPVGESSLWALFDFFHKLERGISVFEIPDGQWIDRAIAALCAAQKLKKPFDFVLFDSSVVSSADLRVKTTPGTTADRELNELHREIECITARRAARLTDGIAVGAESKFDRRLTPEVYRLIAAQLDARNLSEAQINSAYLSTVRANSLPRELPP